MSVNHQSNLSAGVMPGEQQSPPSAASTEMPQEEMPRGEMTNPRAIAISGEMPRGEMSTSSRPMGAGQIPGDMHDRIGNAGAPEAGQMPLGLMTGTSSGAGSSAFSSEDRAKGIALPGEWHMVLYPAST